MHNFYYWLATMQQYTCFFCAYLLEAGEEDDLKENLEFCLSTYPVPADLTRTSFPLDRRPRSKPRFVEVRLASVSVSNTSSDRYPLLPRLQED